MRKDPIISEDWKIGNTTYFDFKRYQYIDFALSLLIASIALTIVWQDLVFFSLFMWIIAILTSIFVELVLDQKERTVSNRIVVFLALMGLSYLTLNDAEDYVSIGLGFLLALKFILIPIENFIQNYQSEILVPNSEKVQLVLKDHISRLNETKFAIETEDEFQSRVYAKLRQFIVILLVSSVISAFLFIILMEEELIGTVILLGILSITAISFSYTVFAWYIHQRNMRKQKEIENKEVDDDTMFPEMMD